MKCSTINYKRKQDVFPYIKLLFFSHRKRWLLSLKEDPVAQTLHIWQVLALVANYYLRCSIKGAGKIPLQNERLYQRLVVAPLLLVLVLLICQCHLVQPLDEWGITYKIIATLQIVYHFNNLYHTGWSIAVIKKKDVFAVAGILTCNTAIQIDPKIQVLEH